MFKFGADVLMKMKMKMILSWNLYLHNSMTMCHSQVKTHTSMSIGDIIHFVDKNTTYVVAGIGFLQIEPPSKWHC
jgi:hypothetical protein